MTFEEAKDMYMLHSISPELTCTCDEFHMCQQCCEEIKNECDLHAFESHLNNNSLITNNLKRFAMEKEFVLPHGVKIVDGVLYFGDHQVMYGDKPYKVYDVNSICTCFAIRHTSNGRLCTTLDIILAPRDVKDWRYENGFIWLSGVEIIGGKRIPTAYYNSWKDVEYILKNLVPDLIGSEWFICIDDENYVWDNVTNTVRRQRTIETVTYEWDDDGPAYDSAGFTEADR